jgi:hypothetical protein
MGDKQIDSKSHLERYFKFIYDRLNQKIITARLRPLYEGKYEIEYEDLDRKANQEIRQPTNFELFEEKMPRLNVKAIPTD